jgi:hypothetical protein
LDKSGIAAETARAASGVSFQAMAIVLVRDLRGFSAARRTGRPLPTMI